MDFKSINFNFIAKPLGIFLNFIYQHVSFGNYGLAIIIFTVIVKFALLPLAIHQYRSMSKMQELQPLLAEAQKKYKNDKEKLNQETMKIYQENKANPAGGCLPLVIQMPILISLYWVIAKPLTYMLGYTAAQVASLAAKYNISTKITNITNEIEIIKKAAEMKQPIIDLNFLGLHLGDIPNWHMPGPLWIIPIFAALTTYFSSKLTTPKSTPTEGSPVNPMQNSMMTVFPLMTGFFAFSFPAGLGVYWTVSNVFQILQQWIMNRFIIKKKEDVKK